MQARTHTRTKQSANYNPQKGVTGAIYLVRIHQSKLFLKQRHSMSGTLECGQERKLDKNKVKEANGWIEPHVMFPGLLMLQS